MSGGKFSYQQSSILDIADTIERTLHRMGKPKRMESWYDKQYYEIHPEGLLNETYPHDVVDRMRYGIKQLKLAYIYAQRIDWYLSGDDGDESFLSRLREDINNLADEKESEDSEED